MKIYSVGSYPISYTGNSQNSPNLRLSQGSSVVAKQILETDEFAKKIVHLPKGKDEATLNYLYKHMPLGSVRKLENFNGERKITVRRIKDGMEKVTKRLYPYEAELTRIMKNVGTNENPKLVTSYVSLIPLNSLVGIEVTVLENKRLSVEVKTPEYCGYSGYHHMIYDNWHDLYKNDRPFMDVLSKFTKKNFYRYLAKK